MLKNMTASIVLIIGGIVLTLGDIIFKFWVEKPQPLLYIIGLGVYLVGLMLLVQSFKTENIADASATLVVANLVTLSLVSWLYFGEKLSALQLAGIGVGLVAILLLELG